VITLVLVLRHSIENRSIHSKYFLVSDWLKTARAIHHNQLLLTKNCVIEPTKFKQIIQLLIDRENLGTRLCYLTKRELVASRFTSFNEENILNG